MTTMLMPSDLVSLEEWTGADIHRVLDHAADVKRRLADTPKLDVLNGRSVVLLFEKPSLRTRVSFDVGIAKLGGHSVYLEHIQSRIGEREAIKDYAKNLERWCDCLVARTFEHGTIAELAEHASVPVINALSDLEHPCQALADLLTLSEACGELDGASLAYVGDGNNVCHALMLACSAAGVDLVVVTPPGFEPKYTMIERAHERAVASGATLTVSSDLAAIAGASAVYTDTWVSMGQADTAGKRLEAFRGYQITPEVMAIAGGDARFMHCLPAHRGVEVVDAVIDAPESIVYDQAENRMHAQNALLSLLLDPNAHMPPHANTDTNTNAGER